MNTQTQRLTLFALFVALTMVVTMYLSIPSFVTNGYLNLGDSIIMLASWLLGPLGGFWAGSLGSALADLAKGYTAYAPITFVVKGLEGVLAGYLFLFLQKAWRKNLWSCVIAGAVAGVFMALGYGVAEIFMYGFWKAVAEIPHNIGQGVAGMVIATILYFPLSKAAAPYLKKS